MSSTNVLPGSSVASGELRDREGEAADPYPGKDSRPENCKTVYTSSILVVAAIHIISGLGRTHERPQEVLRGQQAAYQPSGNGTSGQGARLSLAARGDG